SANSFFSAIFQSSEQRQCGLALVRCQIFLRVLRVSEYHDHNIVGDDQEVYRPAASALPTVANPETNFADAAEAGDKITRCRIGSDSLFERRNIVDRRAHALQISQIPGGTDDFHAAN